MDTNHNKRLVVVIILFLALISILLGKIDPLNRNKIKINEVEVSYKEETMSNTVVNGLYLTGYNQNHYRNSQILASNTGRGDDNIEQWRSLVEKYFPEEEVNMALDIIREESRGISDNVNWNDYHPACGCYGSFGLFQLGRVHMGNYGYNWDNRFDPETNVRVAYEVWKVQGWKRGWKNSYYKILYNE